MIFLVYGIDAPPLGGALSHLSIEDAMTQALRSIGAAVPGARWVSPYARITRTGGVSESFRTHVAQLLEIPDHASGRYDATARLVADRVNTPMGRIAPAWSGARVSPYVEAVSGPLSWWRSGEAASSSLTREGFPLGRSVPVENPVGPSRSESVPWWAWLVAAGLFAGTVMAVSPTINALSALLTPKEKHLEKHANPGRRRPHAGR